MSFAGVSIPDNYLQCDPYIPVLSDVRSKFVRRPFPFVSDARTRLSRTPVSVSVRTGVGGNFIVTRTVAIEFL